MKAFWLDGGTGPISNCVVLIRPILVGLKAALLLTYNHPMECMWLRWSSLHWKVIVRSRFCRVAVVGHLEDTLGMGLFYSATLDVGGDGKMRVRMDVVAEGTCWFVLMN